MDDSKYFRGADDIAGSITTRGEGVLVQGRRCLGLCPYAVGALNQEMVKLHQPFFCVVLVYDLEYPHARTRNPSNDEALFCILVNPCLVHRLAQSFGLWRK